MDHGPRAASRTPFQLSLDLALRDVRHALLGAHQRELQRCLSACSAAAGGNGSLAAAGAAGGEAPDGAASFEAVSFEAWDPHAWWLADGQPPEPSETTVASKGLGPRVAPVLASYDKAPHLHGDVGTLGVAKEASRRSSMCDSPSPDVAVAATIAAAALGHSEAEKLFPAARVGVQGSHGRSWRRSKVEMVRDARTSSSIMVDRRSKNSKEGPKFKMWASFLSWKKAHPEATMVLISDTVMTILIALNAIVMGVSIDVYPSWKGWTAVNAFFATCFLAETSLKLRSLGLWGYFCGPSKYWHISEFFLVGFAVLEVLFDLLEQFVHSSSKVIFVILRTLRLARVARLLRVAQLPMFAELLLMVNGFMGGMRTLLWSQFLLALPLYAAALIFREAFGGVDTDADTNTATDPDGTKGFATVGMSFFTMFRCLVANECFTEGGAPIFLLMMRKYGNGLAAWYYLASAFMSFGLANVISSIFVESTVSAAKGNELRKKQQRLADRKLFADTTYRLIELVWSHHPDNEDGTRLKQLPPEVIADIRITHDLWNTLRRDKEFQQHLAMLDIAMEEQEDLFDTMTADGSETLDFEELVVGLERMRGDARRSDVVSISFMLRGLLEAQEDMREQLTNLMQLTVLQFAASSQDCATFLGQGQPSSPRGHTLSGGSAATAATA